MTHTNGLKWVEFQSALLFLQMLKIFFYLCDLLLTIHSDSSNRWEQWTKLSEKATLKFINTSLTIGPTSRLLKLGI